MDIAVLIPAYRPGPPLIEVVDQLRALDFTRIVVVDDGSGPDYADIFQQIAQKGGVVLRHAANMGKGAALKTGLNTLLANDSTLLGVVTVDADGQHSPQDVAKVAQEFRHFPKALVLGARNFQSAPLRSRLGNELTRILFRAVHGTALADTQTGLRAFGPEFARQILDIPSQRYEYELDMMVFACKQNIEIRSVGIQTIYIDGNKSSHFNPLIDSIKIYFSLFRFSVAGVTAAIIDNSIFALLFAAGSPIFVSQVVGRIVASFANYYLLKRLVFHSDESNHNAAPKYIASVIVFGLMSYGLILASHGVLGLPVIPAKILIETLIFFSNYTFQRVLVFKEHEK